MKKHGQGKHKYSVEEAHVVTPVVKKDGTEVIPEQKGSGDKDPKRAKNSSAKDTKKGKKKKKKFHIYVAVLIVWLVAVTWVIMYEYDKFNTFLLDYEASYQASQPELVMDEVFTHFEQRDIEYIWANMAEHPTASLFEDEQTIKDYMLDMIEGKTLTYIESGDYTSDHPTYAIEADSYVIGSVTLSRDLLQKREYGFPTWVLSEISFPSLPLEGAAVTLPANFTVYVNGIQLDDTYVTDETTVGEDELQYVSPYGGEIPGFKTYAVSGLYYEPEIVVKDFTGAEVAVDYDESLDIYSTGYTSEHPEKEELEQFGIDFSSTFVSVISKDANISALDPYFPPDSVAESGDYKQYK